MITIESINKTYGDFNALTQISLTIADGEFVALTGASGSGKSTLLNIIGQIDDPTDGEIYIDDIAATKLSEKERAKLRNKMFGFVFQAFYLEPTYTVQENVEIPLILADKKRQERKERVNEVLQLVGLLDKAKNKASNLSGGEMQRAAIARAIAANPSIIIADEPCGNLDTNNGEIIMKLLKRLHEEGKTVIMVTHNPEHAKCAKRIIRLSDGKIVSDEKR